jgi:hypothetical protein
MYIKRNKSFQNTHKTSNKHLPWKTAKVLQDSVESKHWLKIAPVENVADFQTCALFTLRTMSAFAIFKFKEGA